VGGGGQVKISTVPQQEISRMFPEVFFGGPTFWADPVFGHIFPGGSGLNTVFIITLSGIVDIATRTFPFLHTILLVNWNLKEVVSNSHNFNRNDCHCQVTNKKIYQVA
jgi:hypothetical protein